MNYRILLLTIVMLALVGAVSAATENVSAGSSLVCKGPYDILVSLGIEYILPITQARVFYNWISVIGLTCIAAMASQRTTRFFGILVPVFAALFMYFGWFTMNDPASPEKLWGVVVIATVIAVAVYMKGSLHERFGIAGPGAMVFNVVFYIIILQAVVGFVNSTAIWSGAQAAPSTTSEYTNVELTQKMTDVNENAGAIDTLSADASMLMGLAIGVIKMFVSMAFALAAFTVVIGLLYPWIPSSIYGAGFLVLMQLGIYLMYYIGAMAFFRNSTVGADF